MIKTSNASPVMHHALNSPIKTNQPKAEPESIVLKNSQPRSQQSGQDKELKDFTIQKTVEAEPYASMGSNAPPDPDHNPCDRVKKICLIGAEEGEPYAIAEVANDFPIEKVGGMLLSDPGFKDEFLDELIQKIPNLIELFPAINQYIQYRIHKDLPCTEKTEPPPLETFKNKDIFTSFHNNEEIKDYLQKLERLQGLCIDQLVDIHKIAGEIYNPNTKRKDYRNQAECENMYAEAIHMFDLALSTADDLIKLRNNYFQFKYHNFRKLISREKNLENDLKKELGDSKNALFKHDLLYRQLICTSNTFRYIIYSDNKIFFDSRVPKLLEKLNDSIILCRKDVSLQFNDDTGKEYLKHYYLTLNTLSDPSHYQFHSYSHEQQALESILELIFFSTQINLTQLEVEKIDHTHFLNGLKEHQVKVNHIKSHLANLETAIRLAGGDTLSEMNAEFRLGCYNNTQKIAPKNQSRKNKSAKHSGQAMAAPEADKTRHYNKDIITHISNISMALFKSPMDIDDDDSERMGYLSQAKEMLKKNKKYFPALEETLTRFNDELDKVKSKLDESNKKAKIHAEAVIGQTRAANQKKRTQINTITKVTKRAGSNRTVTQHPQATDKSQHNREKHSLPKKSVTQNQPSPENLARKTVKQQKMPENKSLPEALPDLPEPHVSKIDLILDESERRIDQARQITKDHKQPNAKKRKDIARNYERAIKNLHDFINSEHQSVDVIDNEMTYALISLSSWRIEYEDTCHGFLNEVHDAFDTAEAWDRIFTKGMRNATLPFWPKHQNLIELVEKLALISKQLVDKDHNIAKALDEQKRALELLTANYLSVPTENEDVPSAATKFSPSQNPGAKLPECDSSLTDDMKSALTSLSVNTEQLPSDINEQISCLKKNQQFFEYVRINLEKANKNALSAITSRRLIKRNFLPKNYYSRSQWKRQPPKYHYDQMVEILLENIERQRLISQYHLSHKTRLSQLI